MRTLPLTVAILVTIAACTGGLPTVDGIHEVRSDASRAAAKPASDPAVQSVVAADAQFALDLYQWLVANGSGNLFNSPYSISTALSTAYAGAEGNTATQLATALGASGDQAAWHDGRNSVELALASSRPVPQGFIPLKLEPTNGTFGQNGFPFEPEYLRVLAADYGAGLQAVDFRADPGAARELINRWVKARTGDRIPELLPQGVVDSLTRAVLVNAIYFKGTWLSAFNEDATSDQPFFRLDGSKLSAPQMHRTLDTGYASGDGWRAVSLPYAGGASMLVIVPETGRFQSVEQNLAAVLPAITMTEAEVILSIPKWESKSAFDLKPPLADLGISDLFDPNLANLDGVARDQDLFVSAVLHQANITVDEVGTEAAAATTDVLMAIGKAIGKVQVTLTVDRPFIYLIKDDVTGEILFLGRVMDPTAG